MIEGEGTMIDRALALIACFDLSSGPDGRPREVLRLAQLHRQLKEWACNLSSLRAGASMSRFALYSALDSLSTITVAYNVHTELINVRYQHTLSSSNIAL